MIKHLFFRVIADANNSRWWLLSMIFFLLQTVSAQKVTYTVEGSVLDATDNVPLSGALVVVTSNISNHQMRIITDQAGKYKVGLQQGQTYTITALYDGYFVQPEIKINAVGDSINFKLPIKLKKIEKNKPLRIDSIYFDIVSDSLLPESQPALQYLLLLLSLNSRLKVEIAVHTDSRGNDDFNRALSQQRAERIANYLISKGINSSRITPKGYGETQLVNHCRNGVKCSNAEHLVNRRTELVIVDY